MEKSILKTQELFVTNVIKIGGQLYLKSFYEGLGFKQCSDIYDEDGIPHIEMIFEKQ